MEESGIRATERDLFPDFVGGTGSAGRRGQLRCLMICRLHRWATSRIPGSMNGSFLTPS
jgi:hypothetical protein